MNNKKTISYITKYFTSKLESISNLPKIDASSIICDVLNVNNNYLFLNYDKEITEEQFQNIEEKVKLFLQGKPLAYILGYQYFWNQKLLVNENTLIPRSDTEILIESVLNNNPNQNSKLKILDLGTGTGAIGLALASEFKNAIVTAVDISEKALEIAKQNAKLNNISNIEFKKSNWFNDICENNQFDIIVSNPPYIDKNDSFIDDNVKFYEPHLALFSDENGLKDICNIIKNSCKYLKSNGQLYIEHGFLQKQSIYNIFSENKYRNIFTYKDLNNKDRCTKAIK